MNREELTLQQKCKKWLKDNDVMSYLTQYPPRGTPDMIAFPARTGGRPIIIEFKTATGRVTPLQAAVHKQYRAGGYDVHIVRSLEEMKEVYHGSVGR